MKDAIAIVLLPESLAAGTHRTFLERCLELLLAQAVRELVVLGPEARLLAPSQLRVAGLAGVTISPVSDGAGLRRLWAERARHGGTVVLVSDALVVCRSLGALRAAAVTGGLGAGLRLSSPPGMADDGAEALWQRQGLSGASQVHPLALGSVPSLAGERLDSFVWAGWWAMPASLFSELLAAFPVQELAQAKAWLPRLIGGAVSQVRAVPLAAELLTLAEWESAAFGAVHASWCQAIERPCLFLDRDGIIIRDTGYPHRLDELEVLPGIVPLIRWAKEAGWLVVVLSNQAGLAKAKFGPPELERATAFIHAALAGQGAAPDDWFYCPYHPDGSVAAYRGHSHLRKPGPGMVLQALYRYRIRLASSWMVGDRESDRIVMPGLRSILVHGDYPLELGTAAVVADHRALAAHLRQAWRAETGEETAPLV